VKKSFEVLKLEFFVLKPAPMKIGAGGIKRFSTMWKTFFCLCKNAKFISF